MADAVADNLDAFVDILPDAVADNFRHRHNADDILVADAVADNLDAVADNHHHSYYVAGDNLRVVVYWDFGDQLQILPDGMPHLRYYHKRVGNECGDAVDVPAHDNLLDFHLS